MTRRLLLGLFFLMLQALPSIGFIGAEANPLPDSALSPILGAGPFEWSSPDWDGEYQVTSTSTGAKGFVYLGPSGTYAAQVGREDAFGTHMVTTHLSEEELITRARVWLADYLPAEFNVAGLTCTQFRDDAFGTCTLVFADARVDRTLPPCLVLDVLPATSEPVYFAVSGYPLDTSQLEPALATPAISSEQAAAIALTAVLAEIAETFGVTPAQVQADADYQPNGAPLLLYETDGPGISAPGRLVWSVRYERQLPPPVNYNDGCPPWRALYVDAMTGEVLGGPPLLAEGSTPGLLGNADPGTRQGLAYALAALAGVLVVFLVVKLRKR